MVIGLVLVFGLKITAVFVVMIVQGWPSYARPRLSPFRLFATARRARFLPSPARPLFYAAFFLVSSPGSTPPCSRASGAAFAGLSMCPPNFCRMAERTFSANV